MKPVYLLPVLLMMTACGPHGTSDHGGGMQMPPAQVTLALVETRELVEWEEFTGRIEPIETVELKPRVSGYITRVHFQSGELVEKGEILFTIDQQQKRGQTIYSSKNGDRLSISSKNGDRLSITCQELNFNRIRQSNVISSKNGDRLSITCQELNFNRIRQLNVIAK